MVLRKFEFKHHQCLKHPNIPAACPSGMRQAVNYSKNFNKSASESLEAKFTLTQIYLVFLAGSVSPPALQYRQAEVTSMNIPRQQQHIAGFQYENVTASAVNKRASLNQCYIESDFVGMCAPPWDRISLTAGVAVVGIIRASAAKDSVRLAKLVRTLKLDLFFLLKT